MYFELILLFSNNYTFRIVSLGGLWNILHEKEPFLTMTASLSCKNNLAVVFLCKNFDYEMTIQAGIDVNPIFFESGLGFVHRMQFDPGFVNPVQFGLGFVNPVQSDPIRSDRV